MVTAQTAEFAFFIVRFVIAAWAPAPVYTFGLPPGKTFACRWGPKVFGPFALRSGVTCEPLARAEGLNKLVKPLLAPG